MTIQLNHTIIAAKNPQESANFLSELFNLPMPQHFSHFYIVETANEVSLDYMHKEGEITPQHYAFLVSEKEFDEIFKRIQNKKIDYWANPDGSGEGEINRRDGGRGLYFKDPNGHHMEILTRPYGAKN